MRRLFVLATALLAVLAVAAPATAAGLRVSVYGTSPKPKVGDRWTLTVSARSGRKAAKGRVTVDVLMGGTVVRTIATNEVLRGGRWTITQRWPGVAKGQTITFRATVAAGGRRASDQYTVTVRS